MPRYYKDRIYTKTERDIIKAHWTEMMRIKQEEKECLSPDDHYQIAQAVQAAFERQKKSSQKVKI